MAERERTIERVSRTPDLMGERGPNPKSGLSTPVRGEMSDGNYIYLFFHQQGGPDIVDDDLIGLTHVQALALVAARALPLSRDLANRRAYPAGLRGQQAPEP